MENASKALIIAGSILLSILIIALGMYIFSTSSSTSGTEILDETEVQTFNAKFERYKGEQVMGSNVLALIKALRANATTNQGAIEKVPSLTAVGFANAAVASQPTAQNNVSDYVGKLTEIENGVQKSHRYKVTLTYDSTTGLINAITVNYSLTDTKPETKPETKTK